jgi:hypothetical protein
VKNKYKKIPTHFKYLEKHEGKLALEVYSRSHLICPFMGQRSVKYALSFYNEINSQIQWSFSRS